MFWHGAMAWRSTLENFRFRIKAGEYSFFLNKRVDDHLTSLFLFIFTKVFNSFAFGEMDHMLLLLIQRVRRFYLPLGTGWFVLRHEMQSWAVYSNHILEPHLHPYFSSMRMTTRRSVANTLPEHKNLL